MVRARIVKIGNSKGIRIPKPLLEQSGLEEEVELAVRPNELVIRPVQHLGHPRQGWEEDFRRMGERGDDRLLDAGQSTPTRWDEEEWEWS